MTDPYNGINALIHRRGDMGSLSMLSTHEDTIRRWLLGCPKFLL